MKTLLNQAIFLSTIVMFLLVPAEECPAWVGLELDAKATGVEDRYGATGTQGRGSLWELSGRVMYQDSFASLDTELHWLGQASSRTGDILFLPLSSKSPFRSLDLETVHDSDDRSVLYSEIDRLSLTINSPGFVLKAGRQAVSWGEAFYFNFGDVFGAFPVTETNRRYKPGIDAVSATFSLGAFSDLSLVGVPVEDESDCIAANIILPLGPGTFSITGGQVLESDKIGAGYTVDISGTQVYGSALFTRNPDSGDYSQAVLGAQRQIGPYTLVMGEVYRNGWGTDNPDDYPFRILTDEYLSGNVLTLGRYSMAVQMSRQISPLVTLTPALFSNLSDGSALLRMDGSLSLSDLTDMTGGFFVGLGRRPDGAIPRSEYGSVPISLYIEIVHNI